MIEEEHPPHLLPTDGPDELAEQVVAALGALFGQPRWRPTDDRSANWLMWKLGQAQRELDGHEAYAAEAHERIATWLEHRSRAADRTRAWAQALLCRYLEDLHDADPKVKSVVLPDGKVTSTAGRLEWQIVDADAAVRAFTDEGLSDLVQPVMVVGVQALAKALVADEESGVVRTPEGTTIPGLAVARPPRTYKATPS